MKWGKQTRFCPNCGTKHYDEKLSVDHVKSMCCDAKCRAEWEIKYACMVLGKDAPPSSTALSSESTKSDEIPNSSTTDPTFTGEGTGR